MFRRDEYNTDTCNTELEATVVLGSSLDAHTAEIRAKLVDANMTGRAPLCGLTNVLDELVNRFHEFDDLTARLNKVGQSVTDRVVRSTRRLELEALHAGRVSTPLTQSLSHSRFLRPGHQCGERVIPWPAS